MLKIGLRDVFVTSLLVFAFESITNILSKVLFSLYLVFFSKCLVVDRFLSVARSQQVLQNFPLSGEKIGAKEGKTSCFIVATKQMTCKTSGETVSPFLLSCGSSS